MTDDTDCRLTDLSELENRYLTRKIGRRTFTMLAAAMGITGPNLSALADQPDKGRSNQDAQRTGQAMTGFKLSGVTLEQVMYKGREAYKVTMPSSSYQDPARDTLSDRDLMAWKAIDFANGTIEVDVASTLAPDAPAFARGFIGIAFRIDGGKSFESVYLRPTNSRVDDQVRRNHSIQYWAYPDHDFARLRREQPEKYESYVDLAMDEWIKVKIVVNGTQAKIYINGASQPSLVVSDLKLGPAQRGGIGYWLETGTVGYFSELKVSA